MLVVLVCAAAGLIGVQANAYGITRSPAVAALINAVAADQDQLRLTLDELTGVSPALVGGRPYRFLTRWAASGVPIDRAEQYVYEHLRADGLSLVRYQAFRGSVYGRNVIGQITGTKRPNELVIVCAHLDSKARPDPRRAPGANDNGSSVAALLYMARALGHHRFDRTVRFVFFGGEELGFVGSLSYARAARNSQRRIVAVINADMIGWNGSGTHAAELHTRSSGRGDADIWTAARYLDVVRIYGIAGLKPHIVKDGAAWSDHSSFWKYGYGATCLIEDDTARRDPYYHTSGDTVAHMSWRYYVRVTKGLIGTVAHLACLKGTGPSGDISVYRIKMSPYSSGVARGARATVTVCDSTLTPLQGARVSGSFSGATVGSYSAITDAYGRATVSSTVHWGGGTWRFRVGKVAKRSWTYDPALNRMTAASITVP